MVTNNIKNFLSPLLIDNDEKQHKTKKICNNVVTQDNQYNEMNDDREFKIHTKHQVKCCRVQN